MESKTYTFDTLKIFSVLKKATIHQNSSSLTNSNSSFAES